jgi:hypothetical protein
MGLMKDYNLDEWFKWLEAAAEKDLSEIASDDFSSVHSLTLDEMPSKGETHTDTPMPIQFAEPIQPR